MIVTGDSDELILVEQEHHAHLTGDLAARVPRGRGDHAAFVAAARVHDNGWRETDRAPTVDAAGWPRTFTTVTDDTYEAVWRRGIARAADVDPMVGLLVGLHGARFFGGRTSPGMRALDDSERTRQNRVLADLGLGGSWRDLPEEVDEPSQRIAMLDALSLMLCGAIDRVIAPSVGEQAYTLTPTPAPSGLATVSVRPWPFDGPVPSLRVWARRVPRRPCASDEDLQTAFAEAAVTTLAVELG